MRRHLAWLGVLAALALLSAACGDDDTLSDEAYFESLENVDILTEGRGAELVAALVAAAVEPGSDVESEFLDDLRRFFLEIDVAVLEAVLVDARNDVAALSPPHNLAGAHDVFLDAADALIDQLERALARAKAGEAIEAILEDPPAAAFDDFDRACATLQQLGLDRGIEVSLSCAD